MGFSPDDLAAAATNPQRPPARKKATTSVGSIIVGLLVLGAVFRTWMQERRDSVPLSTHLAAAVAGMQAKLPIENPPGVIIEQVLAEGENMVLVIRLAQVKKADLAAPELAQWQADEATQLQQTACANPDSRAMLDEHVNVKRRFVDADRQPLFEVGVTTADCKGKAGG
jgi:hypothetical protein